MKKLFHDTLTEVTIPESSENGTSSENYDKLYKMGRYVLDPKYTDFIGKWSLWILDFGWRLMMNFSCSATSLPNCGLR